MEACPLNVFGCNWRVFDCGQMLRPQYAGGVTCSDLAGNTQAAAGPENKYAQLQLRKYESSITTNTFAWKILMEIYSSQTAQPLHKHFSAFVRKDRTELIWSWRNTLHSTTAQDVND